MSIVKKKMKFTGCIQTFINQNVKKKRLHLQHHRRSPACLHIDTVMTGVTNHTRVHADYDTFRHTFWTGTLKKIWPCNNDFEMNPVFESRLRHHPTPTRPPLRRALCQQFVHCRVIHPVWLLLGARCSLLGQRAHQSLCRWPAGRLVVDRLSQPTWMLIKDSRRTGVEVVIAACQ